MKHGGALPQPATARPPARLVIGIGELAVSDDPRRA